MSIDGHAAMRFRSTSLPRDGHKMLIAPRA
jgi:hypothetical protein